MKSIGRRFIAALMAASMCMGAAAAADVQEITLTDGEQAVQLQAWDDSLPIPALTGQDAADIIKVAESQVGYKESSTGETVYGAWAGSSRAEWCSEFLGWAGEQAGVSADVFPWATSAYGYMKKYSSLGRFYLLDNGMDNSCCEGFASGTISMSDIRPGDVLMIECKNNYSNGPDHTCLAISVASDRVLCVDGNWNAEVARTEHIATDIHGVCRPNYTSPATERTPAENKSIAAPKLSESFNASTTIQLNWRAVSGADGYYIYRGTSKKNMERIGIVSAKKPCTYNDRYTKNGTKYRYQVRAYRGDEVGKASSVFQMIRLAQGEIKSAANSKKGTVSLKWAKESSATFYHIQYAQNDKFTKGKVSVYTKNAAQTSLTIKNLKKRGYYFRVRSCKKVGKKEYYSAWSSVQSLTVTK